MKRLLSLKFWLISLSSLILTTLLLFVIILAIAFWQQEWIVKRLLIYANSHYKGEIVIKGSHISPFANFPYISIDLENLQIYEEKERKNVPLVSVNDAYLGFDFWSIVSGTYDLKKIKLDGGDLRLIQHKDGTFNITNALMPFNNSESEDESTPLEVHLKSVSLKNIDIHKLNEATDTELDLFVDNALAKFKNDGKQIHADLDSKFILNVIQSKDTTFIRNKHFDVYTRLDYDSETQKLTISPSKFRLIKM